MKVSHLRIENTDHTDNCCAACIADRRRAAEDIERLLAAIDKALREVASTDDRYASNARIILREAAAYV